MPNRTIEVQGQDDEAIVYKVVDNGRVIGEYRKRLEPLLAEAEAKGVSLLMLLRRRHDADVPGRTVEETPFGRRETLHSGPRTAHEHDAKYAPLLHGHEYAEREHFHDESELATLYRMADEQRQQLHRIADTLAVVSDESAELRRRIELLEERPLSTTEHAHAEYLTALPDHTHEYAASTHAHDEYQPRSNRGQRSRRRGRDETPTEANAEGDGQSIESGS